MLSTPTSENAPAPTKDDTMFFGMQQLSEEELALFFGSAAILNIDYRFKRLDAPQGIIELVNTTINGNHVIVYGIYQYTIIDYIYICYTPNGHASYMTFTYYDVYQVLGNTDQKP